MTEEQNEKPKKTHQRNLELAAQLGIADAANLKPNTLAKRIGRARKRKVKTEAAQEQEDRLAKEQAKADAERVMKERFEFLESELSTTVEGTPPLQPTPEGYTQESWKQFVEDEISMYLQSLGCRDDFERLFKCLSVVLPELLKYRGVTPLSRDEWMDLEWIRHGFNGPCPSSHEPLNVSFVGSNIPKDQVTHEHTMFMAHLSVQRGKGEQQEFQNVYRERIAEAKRIWNSRQP